MRFYYWGDPYVRLRFQSFLFKTKHLYLNREAVFVLVMRPQSFFGKYAEHLILVGPILEGFVGGLSTFNGVVHA